MELLSKRSNPNEFVMTIPRRHSPDRPQGVAEVKRKSPSAGALRPDADPAALARSFAEAGAAGSRCWWTSALPLDRPTCALPARRPTRPLIGKGFFL